MNDLTRRAMLGDQQAQAEITKMGELLLCPFCGDRTKQIKGKTALQMFICDNPRCGACTTFHGGREIAHGLFEAGKPIRHFNRRAKMDGEKSDV